MSEFYLEPSQEQQARHQAHIAAQALAAEDLRAVVQNEAGFRFVRNLLEAWGINQPLEPTPVGVDRRQQAENMLDAIAATDPLVCLRLLASLRGIPPFYPQGA